MQNPTPKYKQSKFILDAQTLELVWGKTPTKDGQLWNGETTTGEKMQFAGNSDNPDRPTPYWGW